MAKQELVDLIKEKRLKGASDLEIHKFLTGQGWPIPEIDEAFEVVKGGGVKSEAGGKMKIKLPGDKPEAKVPEIQTKLPASETGKIDGAMKRELKKPDMPTKEEIAEAERKVKELKVGKKGEPPFAKAMGDKGAEEQQDQPPSASPFAEASGDKKAMGDEETEKQKNENTEKQRNQKTEELKNNEGGSEGKGEQQEMKPGTGGNLPGPMELLKETWGVFKDRVWTILGIYLIANLVAWVPAFLIGFALMFLLGDLFNAKVPEMESMPTMNLLKAGPLVWAPLILIAVLIFLIIITGQIWGQLAVVQAVKDRSEEIGWKEAFGRSRKRLLAFGVLNLLTGAILMGGFIMAVIPGIIFAIWFSLATYVLVAEEVGGFEALIRSKKLVEGHWFGVLGRMLFLAVVMMVLAIAMVLIPIVGQLGVSLIFTPLSLIYFYLIYEHLREIKGSAFAPPVGGASARQGDEQIEAEKGKRWPWVAVAIFGVLVFVGVFAAALILVAINPVAQFEKARDASRQMDLSVIQGGIEQYYIENHHYPATLNELVPEYVNQLPKDPESNQDYEYQVWPSEEKWLLCADYESDMFKENCSGPCCGVSSSNYKSGGVYDNINPPSSVYPDEFDMEKFEDMWGEW